MKQKIFFLLFFLFFLCQNSFAQRVKIDTLNGLNKKRLTAVLTTEAALYAGSMTGLYFLWYSDYPQSNFHFKNDNKDWLQLDKMGHITTAYHVGMLGYEALKWTGIDNKKALWYGGSLGFLFLTTVEVFDGFSTEWGASWGDVAANAFGTAFFIGQQALWNEQRILIKYSYHNTKYAKYRPDLLGSNTLESMLKDYNGTTFWMSGNIHAFLNPESKFPKWLNIAFGYGANGLLGSRYNATHYNGEQLPYFDRVRQYYLSADIDLSRIPVKNKTLKFVLKTLNFIKIPLPTIEYNSANKWVFHAFYF